ncbi:Acyl-CoA dehydrogenase, short-chain specific [Pseudonocardia sp. Ae263_Ps1]|nr:Acyl-CoA dehydrogenase, short-chain specific [Pseudonocardia sp. Ae150A_Ps1]OLL86435.1 Acyl-CoA dehydrogenase, short-chain specific [Pseudonocardia sp. Ae263_Ps1]OLL93524.1 Acyl-CoA dehydrogenase, short-chain specific [Pseudonocardia sp. Ae356_Ps1]
MTPGGTSMFDLTDEQRELKELAARLGADLYAPRAREWDTARAHLPEVERRRLGELGLLALTLPEEFGGGGRPLTDALVVLEELAKASPVAAWPVFEASTGPARVIDLFGSDEQRKRILPAVASGETTIAVSISEPDAGSAATDATTTARIEGDEVVLNGTKRWCSGAGFSEKYLVYVRFGTTKGAKGMGAVLVDKDNPGLTFGPQENLMGFRGIGSADMFLTDARVPLADVIVPEGGFGKLFTAFSIERLGNATMSLAVGQTALDRTVRYVRERHQFGREISEFQMVQGALADMVAQVDAARLLIRRAADEAGTGHPDPLSASVAKCFTNEMAKRVSDLAMQLHGGYGYSEEYEIERLHRDSHGWALAGGGTPAMQKIRIASEYLGRRFDQRPARPADSAV